MSKHSIAFYHSCLLLQTIFYLSVTLLLDYLIFKYKTKEKNININPADYMSSVDLIKETYKIMDLTQ